jgi:4-hydroxy-3-methylbut-2-enyl diphosphate reductase
MKIIFAKEIGFCFGVKRALKMVQDNLPKLKKPIKMYGSLVHNEEVAKYLIKKMGIKIIVDDFKKIKKGTLIISAHGISPAIKNELQRRPDLDLLDTICPTVAQVQKTAELLQKEKKEVLIFGDPNHQEVLGIKGAAKEKAIVFCSKEELLKFKPKKNKKYGLVVQTTQNFEKFKEIEKIAKRKIPQIAIFNTICQTSFKRQTEIRKLAKKVDTVLIIGSTTSANTKRLYQISSKINPGTFFVKTAEDLKREWFENVKNVGIGAGASTPYWVINEVVKKLKTYDSKKKNKKN